MRTVALFAIAILIGCGPDDDGDRDAGTPGDAGEDAAALPDAAADAGDPPCTGTVVTEFSGTLLDADGSSMADATVGVCVRAQQHAFETLVCLTPAPTDADGRWSTTIPASVSCVHRATARLVAPGFATTYCDVAVEGAGPSVSAPEFRLFAMPSVPPAWGDGDAEIVLSTGDGSEVSIRPSDVDPAQELDAVRLLGVDPTSTRPCFVPEGQTLLSLIVLEPESNVVREGGLPARLHDATGAVPGTAVSFYVLGGLRTILDGAPVPEGEWVPFADGVVGDDGTISTPDADGLPQLGWIGVVAP